MKIKERILKSIEELNRLLGIAPESVEKSVEVESEEAKEEEVSKSVEEVTSESTETTNETKTEETASENSEEVQTTENAEATGDVAQDAEELTVKSTELGKLLDLVVETAQRVGNLGNTFAEVAKNMEEKEKLIVEQLSKSIMLLCENVEKLNSTVAELHKRVEKIENEPVKKSVTVINRFPEEEKVKKNLSIQEIGNRLTELVIEGKVSPAELARFDVAKSVDVLSAETRKLLGL